MNLKKKIGKTFFKVISAKDQHFLDVLKKKRNSDLNFFMTKIQSFYNFQLRNLYPPITIYLKKNYFSLVAKAQFISL